ncbi:hypothetical protein [Flavivirga algicola]|uniref:Uncharacterized protein n=1 Tax=Flavivirga algicola TaxID=2729136 RepID=A0ABX1RZ88_9FLAO|nr:hypothetical protein [Flavivirga algicola]NMH87655.1 hypothetical protein [Flavivirga algicola]
MTNYYANKRAQLNGDHEVHTGECLFLPHDKNRKHLGEFGNCHDAVKEAKKHYSLVNGCYYCSKDCHTF